MAIAIGAGRSNSKSIERTPRFANTVTVAGKSAGASEDLVGTFIYFSELLSRTVVDAGGKPIGKLWALSIQLPEPYPTIRQLFAEARGATLPGRLPICR